MFAQRSSAAVRVAGPAPHPPRLRYPIVEPLPAKRRWHGPPIPHRVRVGAAVAALTVLAVALLRGQPYRMPDRLGGLSEVFTPPAGALVDPVRAALRDDGVKGDVAAFGAGGAPSYVVLVYRAGPVDAAAALRSAAERWGAATDTVVRTSATQLPARHLSQIACAPFAGSAFRAMCAWADPAGFVGAVVSLDASVSATSDLAAAARPAVRR